MSWIRERNPVGRHLWRKHISTETAVRTTSKAIQIHGAMGLSEEYPVERYFRDARTLTIPDGTTQMQKLIIGRDTLGIKAFVKPLEHMPIK